MTDEESVERKASRKEREGRERKGAKKQRGTPGKHYRTSQSKQHPSSRGKRKNVTLAHLPARRAQRTMVPRVPHPHIHGVCYRKDARGHVQLRV